MAASLPYPAFLFSRRPWWQRLSLGVGGGYLAILGLLMWFEESLLFFPFEYPRGDWRPRMTFEDAQFSAADGTKLHGWFLPHDNPRHVMLLAHGNAGNVAMWAPEGDRLRKQHQAAVLVFDYRGYGKSEGAPTEAGILADARAARAWLARRTGVAEHEIVLVGRSLGSGVMVDLAAHDGARGLVLISGFTSLPDVAAVHYPWVPMRRLMRNRLNAVETIKDYHGPLIVFHGDDDDLIPIELAQRLFAAANEPKDFVILPRTGHNDDLPAEYDRRLGDFLAKLPALP